MRTAWFFASLAVLAATGAGAATLDADDVAGGGWTAITGDFREPIEEERLQEALQGAPNFIKIGQLPSSDPNVALSRSVGQLFYLENDSVMSSCTGSLVARNLFLTNHHCMNDDAGPLQGDFLITMEHVEEGELGDAENWAVATRVLAQDQHLDFALLELSRPLGDRFGWVQIDGDESAISRMTHVKIIQHPQGRSKEIVVDDTDVVKVAGPFIHYIADTEGGSSGSPVFDINGDKIVALHHVGVRGRYNEGVLIHHIEERIRSFLPQAPAPAAAPSPAPAPSPAAPAQPAAPAPAPVAPPPEPEPEPDGWMAITGE